MIDASRPCRQLAAGRIAQAFAFAAYGQMLVMHNAAGAFVPGGEAAALTSLGYSGEFFDLKAQQQYLRARFYNPETGHFASLDPFFGDPQKPQSFHKYAYTSGDPILFGDPTGRFEGLIGAMISSAISNGLQAMNAFSRFAARQFAIAVIETTVEVLIGMLISLVTSVPFEPKVLDVARSLGTNFLSNLVTAGIGNKTKKAIIIRNVLDFAIRVISDVAIGGENILWAAAVNLMAMGGTALLLFKYGRKIFGECVGRFGGCFVAGTPVVVAFDDDAAERDSHSAGRGLVAVARQTLTKPIETIRLGSRVVTAAPDHLPHDDEFGRPEQGAWRQLTVLQHRSDGTEIEMQLLRPAWWIQGLRLEVGTVINLQFPELGATGHAKVQAIDPCPPIESGEGQVVIGRFVSRSVTNLLQVTLDDGTQFTGTTTHPIWSLDANDWKPLGGLTAGERLSTFDGEVRIESINVVSHSHDVYNIEVHGHHVYRLLSSGVLVHNVDYSRMIAQVRGLLHLYPVVVDPRTSRLIEFPPGIFTRTGTAANPLPYTNIERGEFIAEWIRRGYPEPHGGWGTVQLHQIHPREWGGNNDFWNIVPLPVDTHNLFSRFWDILRNGSGTF